MDVPISLLEEAVKAVQEEYSEKIKDLGYELVTGFMHSDKKINMRIINTKEYDIPETVMKTVIGYFPNNIYQFEKEGKTHNISIQPMFYHENVFG